MRKAVQYFHAAWGRGRGRRLLNGRRDRNDQRFYSNSSLTPALPSQRLRKARNNNRQLVTQLSTVATRTLCRFICTSHSPALKCSPSATLVFLLDGISVAILTSGYLYCSERSRQSTLEGHATSTILGLVRTECGTVTGACQEVEDLFV